MTHLKQRINCEENAQQQCGAPVGDPTHQTAMVGLQFLFPDVLLDAGAVTAEEELGTTSRI